MVSELRLSIMGFANNTKSWRILQWKIPTKRNSHTSLPVEYKKEEHLPQREGDACQTSTGKSNFQRCQTERKTEAGEDEIKTRKKVQVLYL